MTETATETAKETIGRWRRALRLLHLRAQTEIDYAAVVQHVREDGALSGRYQFMTLMSCAIATLGLLLSSPAIVIGAMLISPLMGPIVQLGMSLCILDFRAMRSSLLSLGVGVGLVLVASAGIVALSPLTQATPEILSRTQPNLFDLLVAIFSGLAGGYAVVARKGETIVGVAIATALMPPLCVTGYGLATGSFAITWGAGFLFMTNLLAIALSVTLVAKWYGFGYSHGRGHTVWQTSLIVATFIALSVPLGFALHKIVVQTQYAALARDAIEHSFEGEESRISEFKITSGTDGNARVDAVVLSRTYHPNAEHDLQAVLDKESEHHVVLSLHQVMVDRDLSIEKSEILQQAATSMAPLQSALEDYKSRDTVRNAMANAAPFKLAALQIDDKAHTARLYPEAAGHGTLAEYRAAEQALAKHFSGWQIVIVPPASRLPPIHFADGSSSIDSAATSSIGNIVWALRRWNADKVRVIGYASSTGSRRGNTKLALARSRAVLLAMQPGGISGTAIGAFLAYNQRADERAYGLRLFQRVDVELAENENIPSPGEKAIAPAPAGSAPAK